MAAERSVVRDPARDLVFADQVLHGYQDGHRALASSVDLPDAASKTLLRLSDAGDVAADSGYSTLLSGFPLPGTRYYAFLKTWPAPEGSRLGAVWSHTLLVAVEDLASLEPSGILEAFRRPTKLPDAHYSHRVQLQSGAPLSKPEPSEQIPLIVWALYEAPEKPVCALLDEMTPSLREFLLVSLLLQQWPELQGKFSFAEAPSWERRLQERTFDLHATTTSGINAITRSRNHQFRVVRARARSAPPRWATSAAEELFVGRGLRRFLQQFGPDLPVQRAAVSPLAETWAVAAKVAKGGQRVESLISVLNRRFPRRSEMTPLKTWLLGEDRQVLSNIREADLLGALARSSDSTCLSASTLRIKQRTEMLWQSSRDDAFALLEYVSRPGEDGEFSHLAPQILRGLTASMSTDDLSELAKKSPSTLRSAVENEPALLAKRKLWRSDKKTVKQLIRLTASLDLSDEIGHKVVESILAVCQPEVAGFLFREWPESVTAVFETVSQNPSKSGWVRQLPIEILQDASFSPEPELIADLAASLAFDDVMELPIDLWRRAVPVLEKARSPVSTGALTNLLGVALAGEARGADELAALAYSRVYPQVVSNDIEDDKARATLENLSVGAEKWDLGKGIAIALAEAFRTRKTWHVHNLLLIKDRRAFKDLLDHDAERHKGMSLAGSLAAMVPEVQMTNVQSNAIRDILRKHGKKEDLLDIIESLWKRFFSLI